MIFLAPAPLPLMYVCWFHVLVPGVALRPIFSVHRLRPFFSVTRLATTVLVLRTIFDVFYDLR
jgi:hypothetical protein